MLRSKFDRMGKFYVDSITLLDLDTKELAKLFKDMIIMRCEYLVYMDAFCYVAYHPDFNKVDPKKSIPRYHVNYSKRDGAFFVGPLLIDEDED